MPTFNAILTNAGLALYTAAVASGTPVQLTAMSVGDGNGNPTTPDPVQTALVHEVYRNNLSSMEVDPSDPTLLFAEFVVPPDQGGWAIREVGLFTSSGVLFAVANFPDTYKPVVSDGSSRDLVIKFGLKLANSSAVTLVIDATIVTASRQWVLSTITAAYLIPGGTTDQLLAKNTNADGDFKWVNPGASFNFVVDSLKEEQTAIAAQTVFTLATITTTGVAVYVEGGRVHNFTVLNATQLQLPSAPGAGIKVLFVKNEPNEPFNIVAKMRWRAFFQGQT